MKLKVQGQTFVCNESEAGLGCSGGAGEHLVMGTKLPCCCSLVPMPAHIFADASLDPVVMACHYNSNLLQLPPVEMLPLILGGLEQPAVSAVALPCCLLLQSCMLQ